jgi:hypothetical protein
MSSLFIGRLVVQEICHRSTDVEVRWEEGGGRLLVKSILTLIEERVDNYKCILPK